MLANLRVQGEVFIYVPTMPNKAVKISSSTVLPNVDIKDAQPRVRAAAAGLGQVSSVMNGGDVLFRYPQQLNYPKESVPSFFFLNIERKNLQLSEWKLV